jgi:K+-sensing histidine kinase KdpD
VTEQGGVLGRHADQFPLTDLAVSRRHSELTPNGQGWQIRDLASANGTYVNGARIDDATPLKHGDQIKIGGSLLIFRLTSRVRKVGDAESADELVDVDSTSEHLDTSILKLVEPGEQSMILATPETADAVRAWRLMSQLAETIGALHTTQDLLEHVTDIIVDHVVVERVFILIRRPGRDALKPVVVRSARGEAKKERIRTSKTLIQRVMESKSGILSANASADPRLAQQSPEGSLQHLALRSVMCVPIIAHDQVHGVIHLDCPMAQHTYSHDQLRLVTAVGRVVGVAMENQRLIEDRVKDERLAATGETVAYLSHHIRNILQGLRSGADVVEIGLRRNNTDSIRSGWQIVQHNLERIFQLTTNMLTFSKDREPNIAMTQLNAVVEDALDLARRQADEKQVLLKFAPEEIPAVPVDSEGVHQAIFNLIINAIAACASAKGRVKVKTSYHPDEDLVRIWIRDNGPGIPQEQVARVFEPFHSSKGQGGTGLGLAATKKIVDELDGTITLRTAVGQGTSFTIALPATRPGAADKEKTHGPAS